MHTQPQLLLSPQPHVLSERRFEKQPCGHRSVLSALPLRKWVTEVNTAAAMLMTLQGAALGAWDSRVLCPAADTISVPWQRKLPKHKVCEWALGAARPRSCFLTLHLALNFLTPVSSPKAVAQLPRQLFLPKHLLARATLALLLASERVLIFVFMFSRHLFPCPFHVFILCNSC